MAGAVEDLLGRRVLLDMATLRQDEHLVTELGRLLEIVRDDHDGLAKFLMDGDQAVLQANPGDWVDRAEGLVHEQDRWVGGEGTRDPDALLLATGHVLRQPTAKVVGSRPSEIEQDGYAR